MSWLFSQALVEAFSAATSSDGEPCAQLNVMPTPHKFWHNAKTMEPLNHSRFGLTCAVLTDARGEELLTWYRAGFRAKTLARQGKAQASRQERVAGFGSKWRALSVRFDRDSRSWRTHQTLWDEALQVAALAIRIAIEGDPTLDGIRAKNNADFPLPPIPLYGP